MKVFYALLAIICPMLLWAQPDGTPQSLTPVQRIAAQQQLLNGNDTLNRVYSNTACGLNYAHATVRLGQRFLPVGVAQPAPLSINGIPGCAEIDTAFLWFELLGQNPPAPVITLTNPQGNSISVQSQLVGTSIDVCWQMTNTHVYRADVTSIISTNGTYLISGIPVSAIITPPNVDAEGATLLVVYKDPSVSYTGTLLIDDGAATVAGGALSHTMTGIAACANSTSASAFLMVGDLQFDDTVNFNGNNVLFQYNWWNYIEDNSAQVSASQNNFSYSMVSGGDCYTFAVAGLYYQSNCQTCVAVSNPINFSAAVVPDSCNGTGAININNVTGGTGPYTYVWNSTSADTTSLNNLTAGNYYLQIYGANGCGGGQITVPYAGVTATISATPSLCGVSTITSSVQGGTGPYSYLWSPGGQTTPSITVSNTNSYVLTVTDASGCIYSTASLFVPITFSVSSYTSSSPYYCPQGGDAYAYASLGTPPYSYLWNTGDTTSVIYQVPAGTYTVTVTDQNGCTSVSTVAVQYAGPLNWMIDLPDSITVNCYAQTQLSVSANDYLSSYIWSPQGDSSNTFYYSPAGVGIDTLVVMAINNCDTIYDTTIVTVTNPPPPATAICGVSVVPATNEYVIGWDNWMNNPANSYEIYKEVPFNSGNFALQATQSAGVISTYVDASSDASVSPERYQVVRVDACGGIAPASSAHVGVSLTVTPILPQGNQLNWTAYQGSPLFDQYIYRGSSASNMTYFTAVGPTATSFTDSSAGSWFYVVEVQPLSPSCNIVRLNSASSTSQISLSIRSNVAPNEPNSVNEPLQSEAIAISPNPADGFFNLSFEAAGATRIRVYNVMGQAVYTDQLNAAGAVNMPLDLRVLAPGVYMLQLDNGQKISTARLVIKR
jgi:hypothetical protein